jgi:1-phosphatidylinositol-4-phosphate 5-kinase
MNNLFPPHKDIHETYDLKGSTVGRLYPEEEAEKKQNKVTLKDLNWINRGKRLELGPEKRAFLTEQLKRDAEFLKKVHVMDYSLLVGVHNMVRGNRDNLRRNTLKVVSVVSCCSTSPLKTRGIEFSSHLARYLTWVITIEINPVTRRNEASHA